MVSTVTPVMSNIQVAVPSVFLEGASFYIETREIGLCIVGGVGWVYIVYIVTDCLTGASGQ